MESESKRAAAQKFELQAEKILKPNFIKEIVTSKNKRLEEALDLLEKAGHTYKIIKQWKEAGECLEKCGEIEMQLSSDATEYFQEAAHCYGYVDRHKASKALERVMQIYSNQGRFQMAGKIQKKIADKHEEEGNMEAAILAYKNASWYFSMESTKSMIHELSSLCKYADLMMIVSHKDCYPQCADVLS